MSDDNLPEESGPVEDAPKTYDEQVEGLSELLDDPEADPAREPKDEAAAEAEDPTEEDDDDPLGLEADAEDVETDDADETDGSEEPEIKGGRFAPDSAKVTLDDGTVITVADLKRNNLFQRDYTKKTTELAAEREQITSLKSEVDQYAQQLSQFREYVEWYAETHLPKDPGPFQGNRQTDPVGYLDWTAKRDEYLAHQQAYQFAQQQKQVEEQRKSGETQQQAQERLAKERDALLKAMPVLKDPVKGKTAWSTLVAGAAEHYGISEDEINTMTDHRLIVGLRDALAYRRIKAKAPQVQAQVAQKPPPNSGRRAPPHAAESKGRKARAEQLRNSGSFEAGVAALQDFDL